MGSYFGKYANPSSNLNWVDYKGFNPAESMLGNSVYSFARTSISGTHDSGGSSSGSALSHSSTAADTGTDIDHITDLSPANTPLYAQIFTLFVVIFPSLDVASAYPLNAVTLGNNLMATYYGTPDELTVRPVLPCPVCSIQCSTVVSSWAHPSIMYTPTNTSTHAHAGPAAITAAERCFWSKAVWRLLAAFPPVVAAACVQDLGPITAYTGLTGIVIALITPSALAYTSEAALKSR